MIEYYRHNIPISEQFCEKHHAVPKCLGGSNDLENIIKLPARAHFIVHYLLHRAYPENKKLAHAFAMMGVNNNFQNRSSKLYEKSKKARSGAMLGIPRSEETKQKMRKPKTNKQNYQKGFAKPHSAESIEKVAAALRGKKKTKEAIENSVNAKFHYFQEMKRKTKEITEHYRILFAECNLTRKEFYKLHPELSESTIKRYLRGL